MAPNTASERFMGTLSVLRCIFLCRHAQKRPKPLLCPPLCTPGSVAPRARGRRSSLCGSGCPTASIHTDVRRGDRSDETITDPGHPIPPCSAMSLPIGRDASDPRCSVAFHPPFGDTSLWHWSYAAFTGYMTARRALPAWRFGGARTFLRPRKANGDRPRSGSAVCNS